MAKEKYTSACFSASEQKALKKALRNIMGMKPHFLPFYLTAFTHCSINDQIAGNNERLEYLGDAVIGVIIGEYLFKKYPAEAEGFLTEMRSKIVSRDSLNDIACRMGLQKLLKYNSGDLSLRGSQIYGNALEAFIGAVYLDLGLKKTKKVIFYRILEPHINMNELENTESNFKNKVYAWAQHNQKSIEFKTLSERKEGGRKIFTIGIMADGEELAQGTEYSKKKAGQLAAQKAMEQILESNNGQ